MLKPEWMERTIEFEALERYAAQFARVHGIVLWLKIIGVIPNDVPAVKPSQVRLELDPKAISAGYLASVAYEWDSWGDSTPPQFLAALRCELRGAPERDSISEALSSLGRAALIRSWN